MNSLRDRHERWMRRALEVASEAGPDVPIGAVIFDPDGLELAAAHNEREATGDPTAHAEILALRRAAARRASAARGPVGGESAGGPLVGGPSSSGTSAGGPLVGGSAAGGALAGDSSVGGRLIGPEWRFDGCTLVVTLEPCTMCAGALVLARIGTLVFGAWEPKTGAVGSLWDVVRDRRLTHRPEVFSGVLEAESTELLLNFFRDHRP